MNSSCSLADHLAAGGIDDRQLLDLVPPELDPQGDTPRSDGHSSTQSPRTRNLPRGKLDVVALVLHVDQLQQHLVAVDASCPRAAAIIIAL